jgi:hypothetical protein
MDVKFIALSALALSLPTAACTRAHTEAIALNDKPINTLNLSRSDGYIVTASNGGEPAIRRAYAKFGIIAIKPIGNGLYELHVQSDPGLAEMENLALHSGGEIQAVQPNFIYQAF